MATVTEPEATPEAVEALPREYPPHRLTVERYERMVEAGIFSAKEPIFLWHGRLCEKMTKGPDHCNSAADLVAILIRLVPAGWHVRAEQPVQIDDDGMPEPDAMVVRGTTRDYKGRIPSTRDVSLIVEVADSSVWADSGAVLETYAAQGIPVYWIVNISRRRLEVYREPTGPTDAASYRESRQYGPGARVPVVLDGREIGEVAVDDILP
jgi:Uma2 family endonuclease